MTDRFGGARDFLSPVQEEGVGSIFLSVGGTALGVSRYVEAAMADLVICADVQSEVAGIAAQSSEKVVALRLATGETLGTLTKDGCPSGLKRFLAERAGVSLNVGLGQLRAVGALVAQQLLADPAFHEFMVKQVFERLLQIHNGCLEHVDLQVATSMAGGTGGPIGPEIAKAIASVLLEYSNAKIHVQALRIGSLSFSGLGDRVHINGAATLAEDLDYVLDPERHVREVRSIMLVESPMKGRDPRQRPDQA